MPYISPKGAVNRSMPTAKPKAEPASSSATQTAASADNLYLLDAQDTRPLDPSVVEALSRWKGWNAKREREGEDEDIGPLDERPRRADATAPAKDPCAQKNVAAIELKELVAAV
ncbi:uncharacterized protein PV09_05831 [Verruconis gallopava]|uniref:Uncharacterized protein n=1 Tax=Verruconis gallopava TaxID=253628 RepID=A0A0D2A7M7_9PEZI|nr:uncharacterized protein PV09_05831 [Verruconis gallopava]KIW02768.1 hypothetical protein PV09_05831 [Verruconis gallopava]